MIYKKIGDKIPSLSSLLLAGMFLPGGCKCEDDPKPQDGPKSETVNDAPVVEHKGEAINVFPKAYIEVAKKVFLYLFEAVDLDYLLKDSNKPAFLEESKLSAQCKDTKIKNSLKETFGDLSSNRKYLEAFSLNIRDSISSLVKFVAKNSYYHPSVSIAGRFNNKEMPRAYGKAINHIFEAYSWLYDFSNKALDEARRGAPQDKMDQLRKEGEQYFSNADSFFVYDKEFYNDSSEPVLYTADRLARFLTDKSHKGDHEEKANKRHVGAQILEKTVESLLMMQSNKTNSKLELSADKSTKNVGVRGAAISSDWVVAKEGGNKESGNKMPEIHALPSGEMKHVFFFGADKKTPSLEQQLADDSSSPGYIKCKSTVKIGQLFFTLFRGGKGLDFLQLKQTDFGVDLVGDNKKFQDLVALCSKEADFCKALGDHIEQCPELNAMFPVEDFGTIFDRIKFNVKDYDASAGSKAITVEVNSTNLVASFDALEKEKSIGYSILKNVIALLMEGSVLSQDPTFLSTTDVANVVNQTLTLSLENLEKSNASISQKIAVEIIHQFFHGANPVFCKGASVEGLRQAINNVVNSYMNASLAAKQNGQFVVTDVNKMVREKVLLFKGILSQKAKDARITYGNLEEAVKKVGTNSTFEINKVREDLLEQLRTVIGIVSFKYYPFLNLPEKIVEHKNYYDSSVLKLNKRHFDRLDGFRFEYLDANKGSAVTAPAPAATAPESEPETAQGA